MRFASRTRQVLSREPVFFATSVVILIAFMLPTLVAMQFDERLLNGINVWIKPLKFHFAIAVYLLTLSYFANWLSDEFLKNRAYRMFAIIVAITTLLELIWINGAALHGVASHYNRDSVFMQVVYGFMGIFAVTLISSSLIYGIQFFKQKTQLNESVQFAIAVGLTLTFFLTVIVAGYMSSQPNHWVGGNLSDAESIAVVGWATDGGDLRVAHFFATHALHIIPIFGLIVGSFLSVKASKWLTTVVATGFAAFVLWTLNQAISGISFLSFIN